MQLTATRMIADPTGADYLLRFYKAADEGDFTPMAYFLSRFHTPDDVIGFNGMTIGMDGASGITPARLERFNREAEISLMGPWHNFPMPQMVGLIPDLDLGDDFRADPVSDVPLLVLSGTLDGRTYPVSQLEAVAGFANMQAVTVVNAGHNLFMSSPEVEAVMSAFFEDRELPTTEIVVPLPDFAAE